MPSHEDVGSGYDPHAVGHERQGRASPLRVGSASDDRTANNAVRHTYRVLSDAEKAQMIAIKDAGAALISSIEALRCDAPVTNQLGVMWHRFHAERMIDQAIARAEESVFWAVKHITA